MIYSKDEKEPGDLEKQNSKTNKICFTNYINNREAGSM